MAPGYIEYFKKKKKKLNLYPLLAYLGVQTNEIWAKSFFFFCRGDDFYHLKESCVRLVGMIS